MQVVKILADSQNSALAMQVTRKASDDRSLRQSMLKNAPRCVSHMAELRFAIGVKHEKDYRVSFQPSSRGTGTGFPCDLRDSVAYSRAKPFTQRMQEGRKEVQIRTSVAPSPMFQSFPEVRAGVLRRSDRLRRSRPTSSARASQQPALPTSPLDQTDRGPR